MKLSDMQETIREKNTLLVNQSRRILLLEEKMTEWRKKYFDIKYSGISYVRKALREKEST